METGREEENERVGERGRKKREIVRPRNRETERERGEERERARRRTRERERL